MLIIYGVASLVDLITRPRALIRRTTLPKETNKRMGFRILQYFARAGKKVKTANRSFDQDLFAYATLGLLKTAMKDLCIAECVITDRNPTNITFLSDHLGIREGYTHSLLNFARDFRSSGNQPFTFQSIVPITLEQAEQMHQRGSQFFQRLNKLSQLAEGDGED